MTDRLTVAIIDPFHPKIIEAIRNAIPPEWKLLVAENQSDEAKAACMADADIAFVMAAPMPAELLARAPRLRFIQKLGAGVDRIDLAYCAEHGIAVARLQAGNAIPVAEHTLMLMLAAYRRVVVLDRQTRAGAWGKEESRGVNRQIHGKTVGIVGFGAIGRTLARLLTGFQANVLYFDPIRAPAAIEAELKARYVTLDELVSQSDIISLHLPLTKETRGLIDAQAIAAMKPDALLVNCARGGLVDEAALAEALREGRIFGAALDAFAAEPPLGSPFLQMDNVVLTPHAAGATLDNFAAIIERGVANACRFLEGKPLPPGDAVQTEAMASA